MKYRNIVVFVLLILSVFVLFMLLRQKGLHAAQELPLQSESSSAVVNPQTQKNDFTTKEPVLVKSVHSEEPATSSSGSSGFNVNIGNESYSILFEGEDITQELKREIIADLNLNFSYYEYMSFMKLPPEEKRPLELQIYKTKITHWLDDGRQKNFLPDVVKRGFGGAVKVGDNYQLIINQKLIDAYEQAFQFKADHLVAFNDMRDFFSNIKSVDFVDEAERNPESFFIIEEDYPYPETFREIAVFIKEIRIREPSLLDFELVTYKEKDVIRFATLVDLLDNSSEPRLKGYPQFIYMDEKWKIYFPRLL